MKQQVYNPFLPLNVYIPDGEPHVFGDRVYLFGSHDKEGGETFCMLDYEIWSAPLDDLSDWSKKGSNYSAKCDPLSEVTNRPYLYAPDCVQGNDGKFYLYYCLSGEKGAGGYHGPIGVAVCDTPDGQYRFYGHVRFENGTLCRKFVPFDPAVINDGGVIRLYYGTWYPYEETSLFLRRKLRNTQAEMFGKSLSELRAEKGGVMGAVCCELADDMLTVKRGPKRILPAKTKGTPFESRYYPNGREGHLFYGHGFFEGASIRNINGTYYFIYSSVNNHELCYATSCYPDRDFTYRGVIVSNGDVGYGGRRERDRLNHTATTHGSIEQINGKWYVFYHRQTHGSDYSRQACAEPIEINADGSIAQAEITSCGLNGGALAGEGEYPAVICCNLTNGNMPHGGNMSFTNIPMVTHANGERYLTGLTAGVKAVYKYFDLTAVSQFCVTARGNGRLRVMFADAFKAEISVDSAVWRTYSCNVSCGGANDAVTLETIAGQIEALSFGFRSAAKNRGIDKTKKLV